MEQVLVRIEPIGVHEADDDSADEEAAEHEEKLHAHNAAKSDCGRLVHRGIDAQDMTDDHEENGGGAEGVQTKNAALFLAHEVKSPLATRPR